MFEEAGRLQTDSTRAGKVRSLILEKMNNSI